MSWRVYTDVATRQGPKGPVDLRPLATPWSDGPEGYVPERGLVDAVNVALALSQPLLVTGEPGTGKSQLANNIAWRLGLEPPLVFLTKTTSASRDLFYRYDALRHFRDAHLGGAGSSENGIDVSLNRYIEFEALGLAILLSLPRSEVGGLLLERYRDRPQARSVVLVDEIDKAPRDVPNDVLYEIEEFGFTVRETGRSFRAPAEYRPIVVLTSNSERTLPEPFLRRCVFYHLSFPDSDQLMRIVKSRLGPEFAAAKWVSEAIEKFVKIRELPMDKRPATAELLGWLRLLGALADESGQNPIANGIPKATWPALAKTREGLETLKSKLSA